ncbi:hypothetical protein EDB92DRAFT_1960726 [Lactarius akahatsu]|uniref:SAP domain-containing protein n=1 Tax=Lactarius akahatsu TaxID=416441 RepID=A0AAD4Q6W3_9AGAM|nr:hypothetical protein EDB92DRAFT_1960726 [Lactarius akahatsu]
MSFGNCNAVIDPALLRISSNRPAPATPSTFVAGQVREEIAAREPASGPAQTQKRSRVSRDTPSGSTATATDGGRLAYSKRSVAQLKDACRTRGLKVGGNKGALIAHLDEHDASSLGASLAPQSNHERALGRELAEEGAHELQESFESAARGKDNGNGNDNHYDNNNDNDNDEDGEGDDDGGRIPTAMDTEMPVSSAKAWIDNYILQARRKSGRQTEKSVLSLWKRWVPSAIAAGIIPDVIIDVNHSMAYLKYAATRQLLTTTGENQDNNSQRLSSQASLKKVMMMLGRVWRCQVDDDRTLDADRPASSNRSSDFYRALMVKAQRLQLKHEDFDISENTILDSQLFPEHFKQVTRSIFSQLDQRMSPILWSHVLLHADKNSGHVSALNHQGPLLLDVAVHNAEPRRRARQLASELPPAVPTLCPEHMPINGRRPGVGHYLFGILSLYHETKIPKPGTGCHSIPELQARLQFRPPHHEPLIGTLAVLLHFVFNQEALCAKIPGWDWSCPSTWHKLSPSESPAHSRRFVADHADVRQDGWKPVQTRHPLEDVDDLLQRHDDQVKEEHLARCTMPTVLEEMGVTMDEMDGIGHWASNTHREVYTAKIPKSAVVALTGVAV